MANKRDVQLIVRARDEASRAIDAVAGSITKLLERQTAAGSKASVVAGQFGEMAVALAEIEKANGLVTGATDRAEAAFKRQSNTLAETRAQLQSTRAQIENVGKAVAAAQSKLVDISLGGGDTLPMIAQIAGADAALKNLISTESRLTASVKSQETALGLQRSSLQQLSSMANATESALQSLGSETERAALRATAAIEQETRALRDQAAAAREAANAQRANERFSGFMSITENPGGRSAAASASVFQEMQASADAAQRLRDRTDPLAAIQNKLNRELAAARGLYKQGALGALDLAAAETVLAREADDARAALDRVGKGASGKIGFLGLKPYELTNLGYQANDIVTQLASGTAPMQVLAQQGGQVLQLLPNIGTRLVAAFTNPAMLGGIATIGGLAVILSKASDEADRMRKIEGMLASVADGAKYSAVQLDLTAKALEKIGFTGEAALGQVRAFVTQGLNPDYLMAFSQAALDVAAITGKELPEAAEMMRQAFTQGYNAIAKLDDEFQFLTASEREQIRVMFESGRASEGRAAAFAAYNASVRDGRKAADEAKGAIASLGSAVNEFLNALAKTDVVQGFADTVRTTFKNLARDIRLATDAATIGDLDSKIEAIRKRIADISKAEKDGYLGQGATKTLSVPLLKELSKLIAERVSLQGKLDKATGDTVNADSAKIRKDRADTLAQIEFDRKLALTGDDREKARLLGEAAYREEIKKTGDTVIAEARRRAAVEIAMDAARKKRTKEAQMIELGSPLRSNFPISSGYSMNRKNPVTGKNSAHPAIDYKTPVGTPVYAAAAGSVTDAKIKGGNGLYTKINHGSGTESYYLHMDEVLVEVGQWVEKGQQIGRSGGNPRNADGSKNVKAGTSTGAHLDYRVKVGGEFVDPTKVRRVKGDPEKALAEALKAEEKRAEQQDDFNEKLDAEAEKRRLVTAFMHEQMGLSGEALFEARKLASVEEAALQAQQNAAKAGLVLDDERLRTLRETVAAEWDIANARERTAATVDDSSGERSALLQQLETARQMGDELQVAALEAEIKKVETALEAAIDKAIAFWQAFDTPEARTAIAGLRNVKSNINLDDQARQRQTFEKPMGDLQNQRSALMEQIQYFREVGQMNVAEELRTQLRQTDTELLKLIDTSLAWWNTNNGPEAQAAIMNLQNMRNQIVASQNEFSISAGQIQNMFAGSLSDSVRLFAERLVETKDPIRALGEAAISFAASFLEKIAEAILQVLALKVAMKIGFGGMASGLTGLVSAAPLAAAGTTLAGAGAALTASGTALGAAGGLWTAVAAQIQAAAAALAAAGAISAASGGVLHGGGIAGSANRSRAVSPAWFGAATRYHSGGVAGLRANEVPAILERGEEVITKSDVRHRMNGGRDGGMRGGGSGSGRSQTQVLAIGDKEIASAMAGASGEAVTLTHLKRNKETIRQILRD